MGGAGGHIKHVWEITDFTFKDLKNIIYKTKNAQLENVYEKLDGINFLITYKNNKVLGARLPSQTKNFGDLALDYNNLKNFLDKRNTVESVKSCFLNVFNDFQNVFNLFQTDLNSIFNNGENWLNIEILSSENENIIPYNVNEIRIHHLKQLDINGKTISIKDCKDEFINEINEIQKLINKTFNIYKTNKIKIKPFEDNILENKLLKIRGRLNDENTIKDYLEDKFLEYLTSLNINDLQLLSYFPKRWSGKKIDLKINVILKNKPIDIINLFKRLDNNTEEKYDEFLSPLIEIFCLLGIKCLQNVSNNIIKDKQVALLCINKKINDSLDYINNQSILNINIKNHIYKFNSLGSFNSINPIEGVVFNYNNMLIKLTGSFTHILKIIGFYRFKK